MRKVRNVLFPFLLWKDQLSGQSLRKDLLAGVTGAIIVFPQGVAFALIAGLPPIYGLYTAMVTPIVAALFGSSYHLISGPTTAISLVIFSSMGAFAEPNSEAFISLVLVLTFVAGAFQLMLGAARMGTLVNFVSHSVVVGFTSGAALLIATSQLKHVIGVEVPASSSFFEKWIYIVQNVSHTNLFVLLIAAFTLVFALIIKRIWPRLPHIFLAMIAGSALGVLIGAESRGVQLVGELPGQLPSFSLPEITAGKIQMLAPSAFAIALLGLIESVAIAKSIGLKSGQRIDGNQEFIGQGLSNIVGSLFSCYAGSGSFTRSGINYDSGARTPLAAVFAAVVLMGIVILVAPLTSYLPFAAMGGIILLVAYNLLDFHHIRQIFKASKREATVFMITLISTLTLDLEYAIYLGVMFSLIFYLQRTSRPNIVALSPDPKHPRRRLANVKREKLEECPQLKILRLDGSIFFGAIDHVQKVLADVTKHYKHVLIVGSGINLLDVGGAELLVNEGEKLKARGGGLYLCGLKRKARETLKKGGYWDRLGEGHIFSDKESAIAGIFQRLDKAVCASCEVRCFQECASVPQSA